MRRGQRPLGVDLDFDFDQVMKMAATYKYKIDAVVMLNSLYAQHGEALFPLIEDTFAAMNETNNFFCDGLGWQVDMVYDPTTEEDSLLPGPVWDFFASFEFFVESSESEHRERQKRMGDEDAEDYMLVFTCDVAELLLVIDGQVDPATYDPDA